MAAASSTIFGQSLRSMTVAIRFRKRGSTVPQSAEPESDMWAVPNRHAHHVLGPRTAYLIGSQRESGASHLCAATNVTNIGNDPQMIAVALWPAWETTANIRRTGEMTVNVLDASRLDDIWIVGSKYSKVEVTEEDDKFVVGGLTQRPSQVVAPAGVAEAMGILECRVVRTVDDLSDHVVFLAEVSTTWACRKYFDSEYVMDLTRGRPVMQMTGRYFAECAPTSIPDTEWCSAVAAKRRHAATKA